jgi:hypothetical protein
VLENFALLDDNDIFYSVKSWSAGDDKILADLCSRLLTRKLYKIEIKNTPFSTQKISRITNSVISKFNISQSLVNYYVFTGELTNNTYNIYDENIQILYKTGELRDIAQVSDILNVSILSKSVKKHFLCYPKEI